jgi:hypothetical protein
MHVGVRFVIDFPAAWACIAAIRGYAAGFNRFLAVESFGQRSRQQFQFFKLIAGKQVSVSQPPASQRTLEQLDALRLLWEIFESHCVSLRNGADGGVEAKLEAFVSLRKHAS